MLFATTKFQNRLTGLTAAALIGTVIFLAGCGAANQNAYNRGQAQITTLRSECVGVNLNSDSVKTSERMIKMKSGCEAQFLLQYQALLNQHDIGVEQAKANAALFLLGLQRQGLLLNVGGGMNTPFVQQDNGHQLRQAQSEACANNPRNCEE